MTNPPKADPRARLADEALERADALMPLLNNWEFVSTAPVSLTRLIHDTPRLAHALKEALAENAKLRDSAKEELATTSGGGAS